MEIIPVTCPNCHKTFNLTEAMTAPIRAAVSEELLVDVEKREGEILTELKKLDSERTALLTREAEVNSLIEFGINERLVGKKEDLRKQIREEHAAETNELSSALEAKQQTLNKALEQNKKLNDDKSSLQKLLDEQPLAVQSAVAEGTEKLRKEFETKESQTNLEMERIKKDLSEATKRLEQRSMEVQGEAAEVDMVAELRSLFTSDLIEDVPKGMSGADFIHRVLTYSGKEAGIILWERKSRKNFSKDWISKLKTDVTECRANIGIIVTDVLPKDAQDHCDFYDGVYVCNTLAWRGLAKAIRNGIIERNAVSLAQEGKQSKGELLMDYVTSPLFMQRFNAVAESFKSMQDQLQQEKRAMNKIWNTREKQLEQAFDSLSGVAGDIEGTIERKLEIKLFELKELPEST